MTKFSEEIISLLCNKHRHELLTDNDLVDIKTYLRNVFYEYEWKSVEFDVDESLEDRILHINAERGICLISRRIVNSLYHFLTDNGFVVTIEKDDIFLGVKKLIVRLFENDDDTIIDITDKKPSETLKTGMDLETYKLNELYKLLENVDALNNRSFPFQFKVSNKYGEKHYYEVGIGTINDNKDYSELLYYCEGKYIAEIDGFSEGVRVPLYKSVLEMDNNVSDFFADVPFLLSSCCKICSESNITLSSYGFNGRIRTFSENDLCKKLRDRFDKDVREYLK